MTAPAGVKGFFARKADSNPVTVLRSVPALKLVAPKPKENADFVGWVNKSRKPPKGEILEQPVTSEATHPPP